MFYSRKRSGLTLRLLRLALEKISIGIHQLVDAVAATDQPACEGPTQLPKRQIAQRFLVLGGDYLISCNFVTQG